MVVSLALVSCFSTVGAPQAGAAQPFVVRAAEARQRGLDAPGFSVDLARTALRGVLFPERGALARFSGPPGGPTIIDVWAYPRAADEAALRRFVTERYGSQSNFTLRARAAATLAGDRRLALSFETGAAMAHTNHCAVVVQPRATPRTTSLLVVFGVGGPSATCDAVLAHPPFVTFARSFAVTS